MTNLKVNYLGLELDNPIIAASSPLTATADKIAAMEGYGAGAVVLKSIFEEQIGSETDYLGGFSADTMTAGYEYLERYVGDEYVKNYLDMIAEAKQRVKIPVIASINCTHAGNWTDYAKRIESAGADALELNIFTLPTSTKERSEEIERRYLDITAAVAGVVKIPVSVKLGMRFSNLLWMVDQLYKRGCKGVVLFNRFFEPDIDVNAISVVPSDPLSEHTELRNALRSAAFCSSLIPTVDISLTTGIHDGDDVIKSMLVGAKAVQICSAIYNQGPEVIEAMKRRLSEWMDTNMFHATNEFIGKLSYNKPGEANDMYLRAQYMKFFPQMQ